MTSSASDRREPTWLKKARSRAWTSNRTSLKSIPRIPLAIATFCFVGLSPVASGTVGSIAAALLYYFIPALRNNLLLVGAATALFVVGVWASNIVERSITEHDPGIIVADEVVGQWIALLSLSYTGEWLFVLFAFLMFRFFDIIKLYPASLIERKEGGISVMADDVVAGIYANLAAHALTFTSYRLFLHR